MTNLLTTGLATGAAQAVPRDGDIVTLRPTVSMLTLSETDQGIQYPDGAAGTYCLSDDDLHALAGLVQSGMARILRVQAMVAYRNAVSIRRDFHSVLEDALTNGIGVLVDADMSTAATRVQELETQQRLKMQALSIASDDAGAFLRLFG